MDVTKPYEFIGFGAMGVTKPYEFIGFGASAAKQKNELRGSIVPRLLNWFLWGRSWLF